MPLATRLTVYIGLEIPLATCLTVYIDLDRVLGLSGSHFHAPASLSPGHLLKSNLQFKLYSRFGFDKPIVVADAGLLSKANIEELTKDGYQYIIGARPKSESDKVKELILSLAMKYGDVVEVEKESGVRLVLSCTEKPYFTARNPLHKVKIENNQIISHFFDIFLCNLDFSCHLCSAI